MSRKACLAAVAALFSAGMAQATCYSIYRADGTLLREGSTTPVNLSLPIGDTVPAQFGSGASMTVSDHSVFCKDRWGGTSADKAPPPEEASQGDVAMIKKLSGTAP